MKTFTHGTLRGRMTRRTLLAAVLPTAGFSVALADGNGNNSDEGRFRLGGAFIASDNAGLMFEYVEIPLDPEAKTAAGFLSLLTYPQAVAGLLVQFGADSVSDFAGQKKMISADTAKVTFLGYGIASGNPPEIALISVISAIHQFTDRDTILATYTNSFYLPSADGLPHGSPVLGPLSAAPLTLKRVASA